MAKKLDRFQPTFFEYPIQNNRTGWHPVWTPTLLVSPWSFDTNGTRIANSQIKTVTFAIERIVSVEVAGHPQIYPGLGAKPEAVPDQIVFRIDLTYNQLLDYKIDLASASFVDSDGNFTDAPEEGDFIAYTNARGIYGTVEYLPDAEYFDLSSLKINVDNLPPARYLATWTATFCERIPADDAVFCINGDSIQRTRLEYEIAHPGEVHDEMVKRTPGLYYEDTDKKQDFTVNLYRPFADILQDVFDESELFYGINWVKKIPPQLFPYLSYLIGVELPTQGGIQNLDKIRRLMLERGTQLQKLKGSELAIRELFSILGFVIEVIDLWASVDGTRFIAPNEPDLDPVIKIEREEITSVPVSQTDPLLANFTESGFGKIEVPLLYHNKDQQIVLTAYVVAQNSQAYGDLQEIISNLVNNPDYLTNETIIHGLDSYLMAPEALRQISTDGIEAHSRVVLTDIESLFEDHSGDEVIRFAGVDYDHLRDNLKVTFAGHKDLSESAIYIFATYRRDKIEVPDILKNNISNRFDVRIISKAGPIDSSLYDYLIDSLFKYKAFHSLLRKVSYDEPLRDFYNVTDFCNNAFLSQQRDSDANALQIPPACLTDECFVTDECNKKNAQGGLRERDKEVRNFILEGLKEEHDRWHDVTRDWLQIALEKKSQVEWAQGLSNLEVPIPENEGDNFGQDRVSFDFIVRPSESFVANLAEGATYNATYMGTYFNTTTGTAPTEEFVLDIILAKHQILSDIIGIQVSLVLVRKLAEDTFYATIDLDVDHQSDIRSKIIDLDRLDTPDYCYKGRTRDFLRLENYLNIKTVVRNKPCSLMMGTGVYYRWYDGTLDNVIGWHNDFLKKSDQTLHFSNDLFFEDLFKSAALRPSINIEKQATAFPGHRPIQSGLLEDFTHPTWRARPWDFNDECLEIINPLNAHLEDVEETGGVINEDLVYNDADLFYKRGFVTPDLKSYTGNDDVEFTHAIWTTAEHRDYVDFDNIEYTTETEIETDTPIFDTAHPCNTSAAYNDHIDGYPASTGTQVFNTAEHWSTREVGSGVLIEADYQAASITAAATYNSQLLLKAPEESGTIQVYTGYERWKGYRHDCECQEYLCKQDRFCNYSFFKERGEYDFNNDHLEIVRAISLPEKVGTEDLLFNGEIKNWINWDFTSTEPREFEYQDDYGNFYHIEFETDGKVFDISYQIFEPRIWGEDSSGFMANRKVFRKGLLTTTRQIYVLENGEWVLSAEGVDHEITHRQTNYDCDFLTPEDKFIHRLNYSVLADVQTRASCGGAHWVDPGDKSDIFTTWEGLKRHWDEGFWDEGFWDKIVLGTVGTGGTWTCSVEPFYFIDVWGSYKTTKIFIPGVGVVDWSIWYESGSSWFLGYGPEGKVWYSSGYGGVDPSQLPSQTWSREHASLADPLPLLTYDILTDSITVFGGTKFDGHYPRFADHNSAPLYVIDPN